MPSTADIEIANRALSAIAARAQIVNFSERSEEAAQCRLLYEPTRDALLRSAHWNFARATAYLTLIKSAPGTLENPNASGLVWTPAYPAPPWLYEYAYPSDCLKVRFILPQYQRGSESGVPFFSANVSVRNWSYGGEPQKFQVATDRDNNGNQANVILSNQNMAICVFTQRITRPDLWDNLFQEAMVDALGSRLTLALSGDKAMAKMQAQRAMASIVQARSTDGNEGITTEDHTPDWIRVRGRGAGWDYAGGGLFGGWDTPGFLTV